MKLNRIHLVAALTFLASPVLALVQPMSINFQGKLVNPSTNAPATGTAQLTFKIFNAASGGTQMWTEGPDGVVVTNGVFALTIGTNTAIPREVFLGATAYLEVTVNSVNGTADGTAMTPRQPLAMSPYAFTANQLSDQNEVRLIAGSIYSTFTSAGNMAVPYGLIAATAAFTATGGTNYSLSTSSGINMSSGTLDLTGSDGINAAGTGIVAATGTFSGLVTASSMTLTYGLAASSASFGAKGSSLFYALTVSSGIDLNAGTLSLVGSAGLDASGTGIAAATATFTSTVTALAFAGEGSNITNAKIDVALSSSSTSPTLTANTEKIISYATATYQNPASKVFILANVMFNGGVSATGTGRIYRSAVGGTCTTASTVVYTSRFAVAATANAGNSYVLFGFDNHNAAVGTYVYCLSLKSSAASTYTDHQLALIDASAASTSGLGP